MTFCLANLLIIIINIFLTGCADSDMQTNAQSLSVPAECVKLWDINLGEDYNIGAAGTYFASWLGNDLVLELFIYRGNLSDADLTECPVILVSPSSLVQS
jgi:hypothetical protein